MASYKVKSLYAFGLHKTFRSGDIVTDKDFTDGHAPQLVKEGFLEEMPEPEEEQDAPPAGDANPAGTGPDNDKTPAGKPHKPGKKK